MKDFALSGCIFLLHPVANGQVGRLWMQPRPRLRECSPNTTILIESSTQFRIVQYQNVSTNRKLYEGTTFLAKSLSQIGPDLTGNMIRKS